MTQFGTITVGRFPLVEFPTQAATDAAAVPSSNSPTGRTLKIAGQESYPSAPEIGTTPAQLSAWRSDMAGLVNELVPVIFTDKSELNGYYLVTDTSADLQNWEGEQITLTWTMDLMRVGTDYEIDLESRLTGGTRTNSFALTGVKWHSPSVGHYAYYSATGNTPTTVARVGSDGTHLVYVNLPAGNSTIPRWGCAVSSYMTGRCMFMDENGIERSGILFRQNSPSSWTLQNGLVKITPAGVGNGVFSLSTWDQAQSGGGSGNYMSKNWDIRFNGTSLGGVPLGVSLLRNEPEMIVLRMIFAYQTTTRLTVDLTLRRGARHVEVFAQAQSAGQFTVARLVSEAASSGTGYIQALTDDSNGNVYVLGSALSFTSSLANGSITSSASVLYMDAIVGAQANQPVLNTNPYFETDLSNWTATNGTVARSNTRAHSGSWSMLLTPTGGNTLAYGQSEMEPVTAGQAYDATAWAWPTSAMSNNIGVSINWYSASSALLSTTTNQANTVNSGNWNFLAANRNATAPASAAYATVQALESGTPPAGATAWFDEVKLRPSVSTGDTAADLYSQYLATPSELVQGIRR